VVHLNLSLGRAARMLDAHMRSPHPIYTRISVAVLALLFAAACSSSIARAADAPAAPFGVQVVDDQTGRGVPLVELTTVSNLRFVTDSAGWVAVTDPALLGRKVFFSSRATGTSSRSTGSACAGGRWTPRRARPRR
jgi:hypothetical protein